MKQRAPLSTKIQKNELQTPFKQQIVKNSQPTQQPVIKKTAVAKQDLKKPTNTFNNQKKTLIPSISEFEETKIKMVKKQIQKKEPVRPVSTRKVGSNIVSENLYPCDSCGRTFNEKALDKHSKICKKVFINKRKQFNSAKQRLISKEQITLKKKVVNTKSNVPTSKNLKQVPLWKQQSLALRVAMKQVRGVQSQQDVQMMKNAKQMAELSLVKCKFCGRSFNESAAIKHVAFCQKKHKQQVIQKVKK